MDLGLPVTGISEFAGPGRRVVGLLVLVLASGLLAGCTGHPASNAYGSGGGGLDNETRAPEPDQSALLGFLTGKQSNNQDSQFLFNARQELVRRCMASKGIKYYVTHIGDVGHAGQAVDAGGARPFDLADPVSGYGLYTAFTSPKGSDKHLPADAYVLSLPPAQKKAYVQALEGDPQDVVVVKNSEGQPLMGVEKGGCMGSVRAELYGSVQNYANFVVDKNETRSHFAARWHAVPQVTSALDAWRSCMAQKGYPYKSPQDAYDTLQAGYQKNGATTAMHHKELAVANADIACHKSVGLTTAVHQARVQAVADMDADAERAVLTVIQTHQDALAKAKELLASPAASSAA